MLPWFHPRRDVDFDFFAARCRRRDAVPVAPPLRAYHPHQLLRRDRHAHALRTLRATAPSPSLHQLELQVLLPACYW